MFDRRLLKNFDYILFIITVVLTISGIMTIYRIVEGASLYIKQIVFSLIGIMMILAVISIDYRTFKDYANSIYIISLGFLVILFIFGNFAHGAQRWLPVGPVTFQPSEFAKLATILVLAKYLSEEKRNLDNFYNLLIPLGIILVPMVLILKQPDLGSTLVFIPVLFAMLYIAGAKLKHFLILLGSGIIILPLFSRYLLKDYQKARLLAFIDPNKDPWGAGYSIIQSKIAVGSGGFWGNSAATQTRLDFLPAQPTDFIFSAWSERWGFVGSLLLLFFYFIIIWKGIKIARAAKDTFGGLLAIGITTYLLSQIVINIGMTTGLMPVTGLPLPLLSYGGSSLIAGYLSIGILLNIQMRRFMF